MILVKFRIEGKPKGKARPRFRRIGNYVSTYNTKQTKEYEELVKKSALLGCTGKLNANYTGSINANIFAYFNPPKNVSKKKYKELINTGYIKKPDCDNIAKIILDSLNGIAYKDDSQVNNLTVMKSYSDKEYVDVLIAYMDEG